MTYLILLANFKDPVGAYFMTQAPEMATLQARPRMNCGLIGKTH